MRKRHSRIGSGPRHVLCGALIATLAAVAGCPMEMPAGDNAARVVWSAPFDVTGVGVLSAVWGSASDDVFIVGGRSDQGEVYHYDGAEWAAMPVPDVPLLVWVFGFRPDDVIAVGEGGGVIHYDGDRWRRLESGTDQDLWGVWGTAPDDVWIVGGTVGDGEPVILHYDGRTFTPVATPENDRSATSLFKVWGIGSKVFAVGQHGLIIEYDGQDWAQVQAGEAANDDFVSLWGTSESNIVAVGGRGIARVAHYDGTTWSTRQFGSVPGLSAVFMAEPGFALVGGDNGYVGRYDVASGELMAESAGTMSSVHGIWSNAQGVYFAVGGRFSPPQTGVALMRTNGDPGIEPVAPRPLPGADDGEPADEPDGDGQPDDAAAADCNDNGVSDADDIADGAPDCDANGVPDQCDPDADDDGVPDACDACTGFDDGADTDADGVPDGCDPCPDDAGDDADGDGVCDSADACPGFNDTDDADGDGVADGCDDCDGDNALDDDDDGVPNACDNCPADANPDQADADDDGVGDACETGAPPPPPTITDCNANGIDDADEIAACTGDPACSDCNGNGVPDACDIAVGASDDDGDGVLNACDVCGGSDDTADNDADGVPDGCDVCDGFDDTPDADGDGVPDGCDACADFDDAIDADGDGVPDDCDVCDGFDDTLDGDMDGVPDDCDPCPLDSPDDTDGDGVCNSDDQCDGFDDSVDLDMDNIPDGCDPTPPIACTAEGDCPVGTDCGGGAFCQSVTGPDIEIGYIDPGDEGDPGDDTYVRLGEGDVFPTIAGGQGLVDAFLTVRATGFPPNADVLITRNMTLVSNNQQVVATPTLLVTMTDIGDGVNELEDYYIRILTNPLVVNGELVNLTITLTEDTDPNLTSTHVQTVEILVEAP